MLCYAPKFDFDLMTKQTNQQPYQTSYPSYPPQPAPQGYNQPQAFDFTQTYPGQPYQSSQVILLILHVFNFFF